MTIDQSHRRVEQVVAQLQAAALAAVCAVFNEHVDADRDPNPYTPLLTAYDLGRLFNFDPSGVLRDTVVDLDGVATNVKGTSGPHQRRRDRALWVADELTRLGYAVEAERFIALAEDSPVI